MKGRSTMLFGDEYRAKLERNDDQRRWRCPMPFTAAEPPVFGPERVRKWWCNGALDPSFVSCDAIVLSFVLQWHLSASCLPRAIILVREYRATLFAASCTLSPSTITLRSLFTKLSINSGFFDLPHQCDYLGALWKLKVMSQWFLLILICAQGLTLVRSIFSPYSWLKDDQCILKC